MNYNVCEKILNPILRMLKSTTELCKVRVSSSLVDIPELKDVKLHEKESFLLGRVCYP